MTTVTPGRSARTPRPSKAESLSIGVNLAFQDALRVFLEAQKPFSVMQSTDADYAEREYHADAATAGLVRAIDTFIKRRRSAEGREESAMKAPGDLRRAKRQAAKSQRVSEAREAEVFAVILARLQVLLVTRPDFLPEQSAPPVPNGETPNGETWLWAAAAQVFLHTRRAELKEQAFSEVDLTRVLSADPRTEGGRALRRCYQLLFKLIYQGAKKNGLLNTPAHT